MPEAVSGADLRKRADGLKTIVEGDSATFDREALRRIVDDVRQDLANAANMMERYELEGRQREQPQGLGAGSGQPTTQPAGTQQQLHPAGTAPSHVPGDDRVPATNTPQAHSGATGELRDAASDHADRPDKAAKGKDKIER